MLDTFRKEYKPLSPDQQALMRRVKEAGEQLESLYDDANTPNCGREIAIAKTNLDQSIMWAVKGITK